MQLANGSRIGPYEIVAAIGAGGMGEVYRARDTRLRRIVALKILPTLSASDDLRERFLREARAISSLAHPNICALYDIGEEGGTDYLVMEYLEGKTLAERIARGPLPLGQTLSYGVEIAEALQQAHRVGVVHRDLKPGNILLTPGGAKLLDFGLAQIVRPNIAVDGDASMSMTDVAPLTSDGTIAGTLQYMSPEQIEGKSIDQRSDLFSLGVVLYEMVTGRRPFQASSPEGMRTAIASTDPPSIVSLRPDVPRALERIISVAMEKDPERRWQSAHDIAQQLQWIGDSSAPSPASGRTPPRRAWIAAGVLVAGAVLISTMTWVATRHFGGQSSSVPAIRLDIALPPDMNVAYDLEVEPFAISPDGETLAVVAQRAGKGSLYVRRLDSTEVREVEGSAGATSPFWSSDGRWLAFSANGKLWKTRLGSGAGPEAICDVAAAGETASWVGDTILFADRPGGGTGSVYRVSSRGGPITEVIRPKAPEWRCQWPQLFPDGRHFLYVASLTNSPERLLMIASVDSATRSVLVRDASCGRPVGNDRIVYVRDGKLLEQRIDPERGVTIQDSSTIAENASWMAMTARADFDVSPAGVVVYASNTTSGRLLSADRAGTERLVAEKALFRDVAISPDGKRAVVSIYAAETRRPDLWIYDLARGIRDRFTSDPGAESSPFWSPDGQSIVYSSAQEGLPLLARRGISAPVAQYLWPQGGYQFGGSFSPDGANVYYSQRDPRRRMHAYRLPLAARAEPQPIVGTDSNEQDPRASPDGKWLAFQSDLTGDDEIYILDLASGERIRVTKDGGVMPRWRGDARELFCISSQHVLMAITPGTNGDWHYATVTPLFSVGNVQGFDAAPDGKTFLLAEWTPGPADRFIHVVTGAIHR
jgi:serine/threonine protein kinase